MDQSKSIYIEWKKSLFNYQIVFFTIAKQNININNGTTTYSISIHTSRTTSSFHHRTGLSKKDYISILL